MLSLFVIGVVYAFAAVAQPGPFQTYVISQSLSNGWRRTWPAAFAPLLSDGPIAIAAVLVLSQIPKLFVAALQLVGSAFLMYLALGAFMAWRRFSPGEKAASLSGTQSLLKAALVNLLNPNPYIGWSIVMGPLVVQAWHQAHINCLALLAGFYGTMIAFMCIIIVAASAAGSIGPKVNRFLLGLSALGLASFSCYALWLATKALSEV